MVTSTPAIGQVLGHYRIVELVGSGGMGVVFRAHDEQLDRDVAVKILPQLSLLSEASRRQFRREALNLARITDPNVAMAFDFGRDGGFDYLVTEYVPGVTLNAKIAGRPLAEGEVLNLGKQLAAGLEQAHRQGVIHRDLKPGNLRVTPDGRLKILDFGLAFLLQAENAPTATVPVTESFANAGTLPYMSPEQIRGNKPDARADVWSAGVVLYEMATGKCPFGDLTGTRLTAAILDQTPPPPRTLNAKVSEGLERVILRTLQKDPAERYQSAGDLRFDLNSLATGTAPVYATPERSRWWLGWGGAALAIVLVIAGFWWMRHRSEPPLAVDRVMAVLPFESVANDAPTNALGVGLSETLTAKLVQASDSGHLQLVSTRDLVAQGIKTAEQARREFGTDLVLEGSLQQSGDQIRITCSLVNSRTRLQVAARTVTGAASNPFTLQDTLVGEVLSMLPVSGKEKRGVVTSRPNTNAAAYDSYLRGRGYLEESQNLDNIENAISEFQRAISVDANYAPAHAAIGMAYTMGFQHKNQGKDWLEKAQIECKRALAITPQLAEGHTCLGNVYSSQGRYEDAVGEFQRSLDLDHNSDEALRLLAETNQKLGNVAAAEAAYRKAIALRPNYWAVYSAFGSFYYHQARYQDAAEMFNNAIQLAPLNYLGYSNLGAMRLLQGKYQDAVDQLKKSIALRPAFDAYGNLGTAYFYLRLYEESAASFQEAINIDDKDWQNWGNLGDALYQIPSRRPDAFNAYRRAIDLASARLEVNPRDASVLAFSADYFAMLDQKGQAEQHISRALAVAPTDYDVLFRAAILYNHFGETEKAVSFLQRAVEAGCSRTVIRDTPDFDRLQSDARLRAILQTK